MNSIRIERAQNGFIICMEDPAIIAQNRKTDGPYIDPERQFVFDDEAEVVTFITKNLAKIIPAKKDDFASSFDAAVEESAEEEKAEHAKVESKK
jgi:hypothetical protein